ncbi:hypothetical protein GIW50_16530 [Pseudomonas syringae]|uniref:Uncharacterized protein n=1 Tax=Pseudomonas syringae TaxID=317 RepID=A0A9Q3X4Y1_PSESX|nr:hypothetical protein [Pseudomonas syringae]MCF5063048.1 hypothetical protein [Pseudomonas syringae]MCF5075645.1 hypothetical protein [Pseudomonas syringae]MCF5119993.1 hypothetical protein [Pseudomonas syringae]MCF5379895.1 hypothetical protein [Pseudomonas syringae]
MTDQDSNTTGQAPTHRERFAEACAVQMLERHGSAAAHIAYDVRVTNNGQKHQVDGPFLTYVEAAISAEILRKSCRNARASSACYQDHPAITPQLIKDCQANRARLALELNLA